MSATDPKPAKKSAHPWRQWQPGSLARDPGNATFHNRNQSDRKGGRIR